MDMSERTMSATARSNTVRSQGNAFKEVKGCYMTRSGRWKAAIKIKGRKLHLGTFDTAEEAGDAYRKAKTPESEVKGCYMERPGRWKAQMNVEGRKCHLGYFDTAEEATDAYRKAKSEGYDAYMKTKPKTTFTLRAIPVPVHKPAVGEKVPGVVKRRNGRWRPCLGHKGKKIRGMGSYDYVQDAVRARNQKVEELRMQSCSRR